MNKMKISAIAFLFALCGVANAASMGNSQVSKAEEPGLAGEHNLRNESVGVAPEIGMVGFHDPSGSYTSRGAIGVGLDWNIAQTAGAEMGDYFLGASTGVVYSRVGFPTANFFGGSTQSDSNMLIFPVDAKVGYNFTDKFRTSIRGGGEVIYKSVSEAINFGTGSTSDWTMHPNVGVDVEWQFSKRVGLTAKPDLIFTPGENVFVGMLGANVLL